uniref:Protein kinase domain-containing protein n=1 Tax=Ganoderma boninense TaxID=34458 RepID=A0A5K1JXK2_9APHY|nr:Protein kinase domain-containing protein [Ganoderma boninense]
MLPDHLQVPEALKTHPELIKRGVILEEPLNIGSVYTTNAFPPPRFVVKVLSPASEEEAVITRLQRDRSSRNHLTPCEIIRSDPTLLLMPAVCNVAWPMRRERSFFIKLCTILKVFRQIAEGIDHLHSLRIAHLDMCFGNVMIAAPHVEREHPGTKAGRVYIIDFDR